MAQQISPNDRSAWMNAATAAGLTEGLTREELLTKAEQVRVDAHWIVAHGHDVTGHEHERHMAYAVEKGAGYSSTGELLAAETVENAIRLVVGEALVQRSLDQARSTEN